MFNLFHQLNISPLTVSGFSLSAMSLSKIIAELVQCWIMMSGGGGGGGYVLLQHVGEHVPSRLF